MIAPTAARVSRSACRTRTCKSRVTTSRGAAITAAMRLSRGLSATMATAMVTSRTRLASSSATPDEKTVSSVSTSAVQRLITSPTGTRSK